ncbi:MAG: diaminopimelate epimerase [Clostridia bacterium]|nr:diaminopimelate epimerase [Clostridia bacterium]
MKFTKMQGIGNDYVYVDCTRENPIADPAALSRKISDRHFGIGSDGLVMILRSDRADFRMRMFNADGSEAEMCGNASRCVGKYVYERGLTDQTELTLETGAGIKQLSLKVEEGKVRSVTVDMGAPALSAAQIPVQLETVDGAEQVISQPLTVAGREFPITCVSMGNPHCVVFLEEVEHWSIEQWGPSIEFHPAFPQRTNTEFAQIIDREHIRMRVWERGSGETWACGTGACGTLVAAALNGLTERRATLRLNGGELQIEWKKDTGHVLMTGPAEFVFDGEIDIE